VKAAKVHKSDKKEQIMNNSFWNADLDVLDVLSGDERRYARRSLAEDRAVKDFYASEWEGCRRVTVDKLPRRSRRARKVER